MTSQPAPLTNEPYSKISGDSNPIHTNPYFSDFASLPATITHGLWSSAATRRYVETVVAKEHPDHVIAYVFFFDMFVLPSDNFNSYDVNVVGMVIPDDDLEVKLRYIGMRDSNIVVSIKTTNSRGEKVLTGSAE